MKKRMAALLLALVMVLGMMPVTALAAGEKPTKVVVSVEGLTLGQGFYLEPTVVTFDEFIGYWAGKGQTVTPGEITAGGVLSYALMRNGTPMDYAESVSGPGYLATVRKVDKGFVEAPDFLKDYVSLAPAQEKGSDLSEKYYTDEAGWMYAEGNIMSNQALAGHQLYTYGKPYTLGGESYYVVRLQYSVAGLGTDLGFSRYGTYPYSYNAADKGQLYVLYATLKQEGFFRDHPAAQSQAMAVMSRLNATQEEVDGSYQALYDACHAAKPVITRDLPGEPVIYPKDAAAAALQVTATVSGGRLGYQWYESRDKATWAPIAGATGPSFTPATGEAGTFYYKCIVANTDPATGLTNTAESGVATVILGAADPALEQDPSPAETEKIGRIRTILSTLADLYENTGDDWGVFDLRLYDRNAPIDEAALRAAVEKELTRTRPVPVATDYERFVLALTAAGIDPTCLVLSDGTVVNLIEKIATYNQKLPASNALGTVNGYIFALIAYDCHDYSLPAGARWTRQALLDYLLEHQGSDGGWELKARPEANSDVDLTAMAINALAPYAHREDVSGALERAVEFLSKAQCDSGAFIANGTENANSTAMVILALSALGIDADGDSRFVKSGHSVLDALLAFETAEHQFGYADNLSVNPMSNDQGFRALTAYTKWRAVGQAVNPYDLNDVSLKADPNKPGTDKPGTDKPDADKPGDNTGSSGKPGTGDPLSPATGDNNALVLWAAIAALFAGLDLALLLTKKRRLR